MDHKFILELHRIPVHDQVILKMDQNKSVVPKPTVTYFNKSSLNVITNIHSIELRTTTAYSRHFIQFCYKQDGVIFIENFFSELKLVGHGRMMMDMLYDIIPLIRDAVKKQGYKSGIVKLRGSINPHHTISYNELVDVYLKLGFIVDKENAYFEKTL